MALALAFGRIANFTNSEMYGKITDLPWCVQFKNAEGCRHPSQIYESLKNLFCEILAHEKLPSAKFFFDKIGKPDPGMPHLNELRQEKEKEERIRKEALKFAEENNKDLGSVLSGSPPFPKSSDRVLPVIQREARIATCDDYLSTFGAGPCLILMIYDPVTNTSAMAHIDGGTTPESINLLINRFQNKDKLEISIVSGEINVFSKVYSVIKKNGLVNRIVRLSVDLYDERADAVVFYQGKVYEFNPLYEKPQNDPIYKNKESLKRAIDIFSRGMVFSSSPLTIRVTPPKQ